MELKKSWRELSMSSLFNTKYFTLFTIIFILLATISFTINEKMHKSTNGTLPNMISNYLGVVITNYKYGRTGYVGYADIRNMLRNERNIIDDNAIESALNIKKLSTKDTYTMATLDTGFVDYSLIGFYIFGPHLRSMLYLYLTILCFSVLLFFIQFGESPIARMFLMLFLVGHYTAIISIPYVDYNSGVIYNPRLIPMLGVLPLIHIFLTLTLRSHSITTFFIILIQSSIIIMVNHVRSPALWMIVFLIALLLLNILTSTKKSFHLKRIFKYFRIPKNIHSSWKLLPVLVMFIFYKIFFPLTLNQKYILAGEGSHFSSVWSAIFNGMAIHPQIRENYVGERELKLKEKSDITCSKKGYQSGTNLVPLVRKWVCDDKVILHKLLKILLPRKLLALIQKI